MTVAKPSSKPVPSPWRATVIAARWYGSKEKKDNDMTTGIDWDTVDFSGIEHRPCPKRGVLTFWNLPYVAQLAEDGLLARKFPLIF